MTSRALALVAALLVSLAALAAVAAQPGPADVARPWAEGVAPEEQTIALGFYQQGNDDFLRNQFAKALDHYRDAIAHWDHPAIRFNMAVCLINLDQPLEARDALERAMRFGADPLGEDVFVQAQTYRKLLEAQLARLTLRCDLAGADVTLDGKAVLTGPGEVSMYLRPGDHQVVASRDGYLTSSVRLRLAAGESAIHEVRLFVLTDTEPMIATRRWAAWKPYAVIGGGALVAGAGAFAHTMSVRDFGDYDDGVRAACPRGCSADQRAALTDLADLDTRARRERTIALGLFAAGGAAVAAGVVGVILNRPHPVAVREATVVPLPGGAALTLRARF